MVGIAALAALMIGLATWLAMSADDGESAEDSIARLLPNPVPAPLPSLSSTEDEAMASSLRESFSEDGAGESTPANLGSLPPGARGILLESNASLAPSAQPSAPVANDPVVLSGLRISSQSWRRGGLGSKALVTFTLRNTNAFAIRDVEITCAFSRRDGSHVTDRRRVVPGEVSSRSRKTFAAVHVGFVNVNVSTAKCTLVAATKI